jgi:transglutaminase-like putative cysteine protease
LHSTVAAAVPPLQLPKSATLEHFPDGPAGTLAVLKRMRRAVLDSKTHPLIRAQAVAIVQPMPAKNWRAEAAAVQNWMKRHIRYVRDVRDVETLQAPDYTLRVRAGDCDDQAMLAAALLESIGHPTRFVAIGRAPRSYSHVFAETLVGDRWTALETTVDLPIGRAPSFAGMPGAPRPLVVYNR